MTNTPAPQWEPQWKMSGAIPAAVLVALVLCALALITSRVELVLISLPLILCVALAWEKRPETQQGNTRVGEVIATLADSAENGTMGYTVALTPPAGAEHTQLAVSALTEPIGEYLVGSAHGARLTGTVPIVHSGPQELLKLEFRYISADAAFVSETPPALEVRRAIAPEFRPIESIPLPYSLHGLTGTHDSRRAGDGGEFRDIHQFTPGDRLRRIDWKATARRAQTPGELYVRRTTSTADASVLLVVDSRDDVGERVASWSDASPAEQGLSSMDLARQAASSLAAGYIRTGDRVGFQDLASSGRVIQHGGGSRHLARLLRAIELTAPSGPPLRRVRPPVVVSGVLIYVLSTFLDDESGRMALLWHGAGHRVIAVDVLPTGTVRHLPREEVLAHRIVMMERVDRIRALQAAGIELLTWQVSDQTLSRAAMLRTLSRPMRARR